MLKMTEFMHPSRAERKTLPMSVCCELIHDSASVSVGVSKLGRTEMVFVEPGVKINGAYYRDILLKKQLLPTIRRISGDMFIFQQDNAPATRARDMVEFLKRETLAFICPDL